MADQQLPAGWDEQRIREVIAHYDSLMEDQQAVEDEAATARISPTAIRVLCREIGLANTARFLREIRPGKGDYTKERDALFGDMTMDDIIAEIKRRRDLQPPAPENAP